MGRLSRRSKTPGDKSRRAILIQPTMRELDCCYFIEGETLSAFLAAGRPAGKREKGYEENVGNVIAARIAYYP